MVDALIRKPKVLIVGPHPPPPGGMANFIANLEASSLAQTHDIRGFDTDYPRSIKKLRPLTLLWLPIMYLQYLGALSDFKPDLVHVHTPSFSSFHKHSLFVSIAKQRKIPVVLHIHGGKFRDFYDTSSESAKKTIRTKLNNADALIVLSASWKEFFTTLRPDEKIHIVENGIPLEKFKPLDNLATRKGTRFIFVGEVKPAKGLDELIEASSRVAKQYPEFHLTIVGPGQIEKYRQIIEKSKVASNIRFAGEKSGDDLLKLYSESDIFIFPSHSEGMPLVLLEAMAMNLAVIATSVGSIPEVLDSSGGILIQPRDSVALESAILSLLGKTETINSMGLHNRRKIENRFSFDRVVKEIMRIYDSLSNIYR